MGSRLDEYLEKRVITKSPRETERFGRRFAKQLKSGDVVAFFGELGSGKTTMIRGVCRAFGVMKGVKSPSFVYLRIYEAAVPIYHFDFYRLRSADELINTGLDEYFYESGIVLLEWADRLGQLLPGSRYDVTLRMLSENEREIVVAFSDSME
jgi:tRNA threonylcarbamoyladenosine biosynthesis protein TsaE